MYFFYYCIYIYLYIKLNFNYNYMSSLKILYKHLMALKKYILFVVHDCSQKVWKYILLNFFSNFLYLLFKNGFK